MPSLPPCPKCKSEHTYEDGALLICPECAHEWDPDADGAPDNDGARVWRDSAGNVLADGEGLASNERISALALASLKFLDDIEEAVNAALCQSAEPDPNASSVTNYVLCDCID